jgi:hybrid cluster-associated redox disulfide protein
VARRKTVKKGFVDKVLRENALEFVVTKSSTLGDVVSLYPEAVPVLAQAGLHCIGCHVSAYESIEDGCKAHGMKGKEINLLVERVNEKIKEFKKMPKVSFSPAAVAELEKRLLFSGKRFVRIVHSFGGEFDFEPTDLKVPGDEVILVGGQGPVLSVLAESPVERMLRGIIIDYDLKEKDFTAQKK